MYKTTVMYKPRPPTRIHQRSYPGHVPKLHQNFWAWIPPYIIINSMINATTHRGNTCYVYVWKSDKTLDNIRII